MQNTKEWKTHDGQVIRFECHDQDTDDQGVNKGYVVRKVDAFVGEHHVGYLKISYVPSSRVQECYPTIWHWFSILKGWCFDPEVLVDTWSICHNHARRVPESRRGTGIQPNGLKGHEPDDETMASDLKALENIMLHDYGSTPRELFDEFLRVVVDHAFVDYIRVFDGATTFPVRGSSSLDWRRKGIATALYNEGARWLAESYGLPLHGSSLQSHEAASVWIRMLRDENFPTRKLTRENGGVVQVLDYRKNLQAYLDSDRVTT